MICPYDIRLAAQALAANLTVVTFNTNFRLPELAVKNCQRRNLLTLILWHAKLNCWSDGGPSTANLVASGAKRSPLQVGLEHRAGSVGAHDDLVTPKQGPVGEHHFDSSVLGDADGP